MTPSELENIIQVTNHALNDLTTTLNENTYLKPSLDTINDSIKDITYGIEILSTISRSAISDKQRKSQGGRKSWQNLSPDERRQRLQRSWNTRRNNKH